MNRQYTFKIADRTSHTKAIKTCGGKEMIPVAKQESRTGRDKTTIIYNLEGTQEIYYNMGGAVFIPIARHESNMYKYYQVFVEDPLTPEEMAWMSRNDYERLA